MKKLNQDLKIFREEVKYIKKREFRKTNQATNALTAGEKTKNKINKNKSK